jgi:hypothetical protein
MELTSKFGISERKMITGSVLKAKKNCWFAPLEKREEAAGDLVEGLKWTVSKSIVIS